MSDKNSQKYTYIQKTVRIFPRTYRSGNRNITSAAHFHAGFEMASVPLDSMRFWNKHRTFLLQGYFLCPIFFNSGYFLD